MICLGGVGVRLEEQIDEQPLDRRRVVRDLVISRRLAARQLEPVQRGLARHRRAIRAPRLELAGQHRHRGIMAQLVMVVEVFVSERDAEHALADQRRHRRARSGPAARASRSSPRSAQPDRSTRSVAPSSSAPGIRGDRPAVEIRHHPTAVNGCKTELSLRYTASASGRPPASA